MTKQPIVPLEMSKNERNHFKQRSKNESLCFVVKWGHLNSAFSHHLMHHQLNEILEKVFSYGDKLE